ncbi:flagellar biosynthesis anti-sigma factor FlgM [Paenibacillus thermotolerans]|uniref:flagellar biosynthesis anti-sigma factor FlgM n=1 Tax=Paenibacillus thermotolerans TaxID=3027807 RepID=UPI0023689C60|nr:MULTISPECIES: flagellar biosynthesis anti-sigma factor FlgM [unclassified Paenibacillus]
MKINESGRITSLNAYRNNVSARDSKVAGKSSSARDGVQISAEAKELLEAQRNSGAERAERIQELKAQVQSGTYHVDAGRIAEKLLPYLK